MEELIKHLHGFEPDVQIALITFTFAVICVCVWGVVKIMNGE